MRSFIVKFRAILQDAGVSMFCLPVAVTIALHQETREDETNEEPPIQIVINPSTKIEQSALAIMTFVFDSCRKKLLSTYAMGEVSRPRYEECLLMAKQASNQTLKFFENSISKKLSADLS